MHGGRERPRDVDGMLDPLTSFQVFNQSLAIVRGTEGLILHTPLK